MEYIHQVELQSGTVGIVRGLSEEVTAMLFAFYSRSPRSIKGTLEAALESGDLCVPHAFNDVTSDRARRFHEKTTIGYGHKSVADHAVVHWYMENVSAISERDWLSARLMAATAKSTRYVNFKDSGFHIPEEWPAGMVQQYVDHCQELVDSYERLIEPAVSAVRKAVPYADEAQTIWKRRRGWEIATTKRGLDMVRDLLPASVRTSFGVTCSATSLREMLDKRSTPEQARTSDEVMGQAGALRSVARAVIPALLPEEERPVPRHECETPKAFSLSRAVDRTMRKSRVKMIMKPSWVMVQEVSKMSAGELVTRWRRQRGHHMPPDRTAESAIYVFDIDMPWAIHRDLGRHRMMTQIDSMLTSSLGYGCDPMLFDFSRMVGGANAALALVAKAHRDVLIKSDERLTEWSSAVPPKALQYACPMAAMINVRYVINVRELVHFLGLRTTPQGHPSYRELAQMMARLIRMNDAVMRPLIDDVVNFEEVLVGRPG